MKSIVTLLLLVSFLFPASQFDRLVDQFESTDTVKLYNPAVTTALSIIPGGGQLYTQHYTRGSLFLGMSLLMGTQSVMRWNWYHWAKDDKQTISNSYDSLLRKLPTPDSKDSILILSALHDTKLAEFDTERARIDWINWSGWFAGIYAWNLVDAIGCSNRFDGVENPSPKRATLLSAIPFTGAGQFYNGKFFKGAMLSTVQLGCLYSAINFQRVMNSAEKFENELSALPDSSYAKVNYGDRQVWQGRYDAAARSRTMFMWYGVIFYLYGLADASVDAHLHNFERHFQISSSVNPIDGRISFGLNGTFGAPRRSAVD